MHLLDRYMLKNKSAEGNIIKIGKFYTNANGSSTINLPKGFKTTLGNGEELVAKWDGKVILLVPLKNMQFPEVLE